MVRGSPKNFFLDGDGPLVRPEVKVAVEDTVLE